MEYKIYRTDELYHHGIKGMRWGIRRFQRKDGSLTPAGQKRRARLESELKQLSPKKRKTKAEVEQAARKKTVYEMTDAELRERTNRMQIEKEYYDAQKNLAAANPVQVSKGKKFMDSLVNDVVAPAAKNAGKAWMEKTFKKMLGLDDGKSKIPEVKTWEDMIKKQTYEENARKRAAEVEKERAKAKEAEDKAEAEAKAAKEKAKSEAKAQKEAEKDAKRAAKQEAETAAKREAEYKKMVEKAYEDYLNEGSKSNTTYSNRGSGERTAINPNEQRGLMIYNKPDSSVNRSESPSSSTNSTKESTFKSNADRGSTVYNNTASSPVTSLATRSNVSSGKSSVNDAIHDNDGKRMTYDEDGNFIGYWSGIRGDSDGTF